MAIALNRTRIRHYPLSRYAAFDSRRYRRYFKIAFVRNPWDRLLSAYSYLRREPGDRPGFPDTVWGRKHLSHYPDFESFVLALQNRAVRRPILNYIHFLPQLNWISLPGSKQIQLDFLGRFESVAEDFTEIADRFGIKTDLPLARVSQRGAYQDAYTNKMRDIVARIYRDDIEAFGYDF